MKIISHHSGKPSQVIRTSLISLFLHLALLGVENNVSSLNAAPEIMTIGSDPSVVVGTSTSLYVSATDEDDDPLSFQWFVSSADWGANPVIGPGQNPQVEFDRAGVYEFTVTVSDGSPDGDTVASTVVEVEAVPSGIRVIEQRPHLFILGGQSNMVALDPEESFRPTLEAEFGQGDVVIVKRAENGQPMRRWYKGWVSVDGTVPNSTGDLYDELMDLVNSEVVKQRFGTVTFVWMQGEREARDLQGPVYAASLLGLYNQLSRDLARDDINFVIGRLSDWDMTNSQYGHWTLIREAQMQVASASARFEWVDTDDLNSGLHYSEEGYRLFGIRLAETSIELIDRHGSR